MNMPMQQQQFQWQAAQAMPQHRSSGTCLVLAIITLGIYGLFWLYKTHSEHPTRAGIDDSPGMAVGLLFVPILNIYWSFRVYLRLSDRLNLLANQAGVPGEPVNKLFIWLQLIPYIGPIFGIIWYFKANGAHNAIAASVQQHSQRQMG